MAPTEEEAEEMNNGKFVEVAEEKKKEWSMTRMQSTEFKLKPVVNDTNAFGQ